MRMLKVLWPFLIAGAAALWITMDSRAPLHYAFSHYDQKDATIQVLAGVSAGLLAMAVSIWANKRLRAFSSAAERCFHTAEAGGSKPPSPTEAPEGDGIQAYPYSSVVVTRGASSWCW